MAGKTVVGFGASILDYVAAVAQYPKPDAKIRTESFETQGGGNCGNTLTALKRLGVGKCKMVTKLGGGAIGQETLQLMVNEGIDTSLVVVKETIPAAFTYVIVDQKTLTRTCLHTPTEEYFASELSPSILDGADVLHLDGRHTAAAVQLAQWANERGVPVVVDAEKDRPLLALLLTHADYIVTSSTFPHEMTGLADAPLEAAMHALMHMCGRVRVLVTTRGSEGSTMMIRAPSTPPAEKPATTPATTPDPEGNWWPGVRDQAALESLVASAPSASPLQARGRMYACPTDGTHLPFGLIECPVWPLKGPVVDTTGCGDAYIGAFIFGLLHGFHPAKVMALGSFVAGQKCLKPGARAGIPLRQDLPPSLLSL
eukprot:tig00020614_g12191.t1